jgi:hypothetical protein
LPLSEHWNDDWNRVSRFFDSNGLKRCRGDDDVGIELDQFLRRPSESLQMKLGRSEYHVEISAFDEPEFSHSL